ncbi:MAG: hypothetical protein H6940_12115 [Burkholderiales bacterium]|nr:hypothetical protein [Nitrosomonas sp.]MCP5244153.1 hypothetical protein [Burkholderiales bacterium]
MLKTRFGLVTMGVVFLIIMSACSTTQKTTHSPRTAIEQLLHSEAISRSLNRQTQRDLPMPYGAKVTLSTAGLSADNPFIGEVVGGWLGNQGFLIDSPENAQYRIHIVVNALGTEFDETFFGIPPVSGSLVPISIPELAFYKAQNQVGYSNFYLNIFEHPSGRLVHTSPPYMAETFYNDYTVLLMFKFNRTDLRHPPKSRSLSRLVE